MPDPTALRAPSRLRKMILKMHCLATSHPGPIRYDHTCSLRGRYQATNHFAPLEKATWLEGARVYQPRASATTVTADAQSGADSQVPNYKTAALQMADLVPPNAFFTQHVGTPQASIVEKHVSSAKVGPVVHSSCLQGFHSCLFCRIEYPGHRNHNFSKHTELE